MTTKLTPRLVVSDAAKAITFYTEAFDATELSRYAEPGGAIVHAELSVGGVSFTLKDQDAADGAPAASGGTPVILQLTVDDVDAVGAKMEAAGATVVFPVDDHPYGRMGRFTDPFGHTWMVAQAE